MSFSKIFLILFIILFLTGTVSAQPKIPAKSIPQDIPSDVQKQIIGLYSEDPVNRVKALRKLRELKAEATPAIPFIIDLLVDNSNVVWLDEDKSMESTTLDREALLTIVNIGKPAVEPLTAALKDKNVVMRQNAAEALGYIADSRSVEPLIYALKDNNAKVRVNAASALGEIKDTRAFRPLIDALSDENCDVRKSAAIALGDLGNPNAMEPLIALLKDRKSKVQDSARKSVNKIIDYARDRHDIEFLLSALNNKERIVRLGAAKALRDIKDDRAVRPLINALGDDNSQVTEISAEALQKIGKPAVEPLIEALKSDNMHVRVAAAKILGEIKDKRAVQPLSFILTDLLLMDESPILRFEAARALGNIKDDRAVRLLINALRDDNSQVREISAEALQKIGKPAVEPLIEALKSDNMHVRVAAAKILGEIKDKRAVEPIIKSIFVDTIDNKSWLFRSEAARALGKIKDTRAIEPLTVILNDIDSDVQESARWALKEITGKNY